MKCSVCGGELTLKGSVGICEHCGNQQAIDNLWESVDACICYIETDSNGQRTKDSLIAHEVYRKLESNKISTFYKRVSAEIAVGDQAEELQLSAVAYANIILLVGTNRAHFDEIMHKYGKHFEGKKIIPILCDMKPEDLPRELRDYQALNFNAVGSLHDLCTSILNILGRSDELEIEQIYAQSAKRRKALIILLVSMLTLILLLVAALFYFWPKEEPPTPDTEKAEPVVTDMDTYNRATALLQEEKYLVAAAEFGKIPQFKDSANHIKIIYDRYDGYYQTADKGITFYINILENKSVEFYLEKTVDAVKLRFEGTATLNADNSLSYAFTDRVLNTGKLELTLSDTSLQVKTSDESVKSSPSMGMNELFFDLSMRVDSPEVLSVTKDTVYSWLNQKTTFNDIKSQGFVLEYLSHASLTAGTFIDSLREYKIKGSNVTVFFSGYDFLESDYSFSDAMDIKWNENRAYLIAVNAPAELICPEKIGQTGFVSIDESGIFLSSNTSWLFNDQPFFESTSWLFNDRPYFEESVMERPYLPCYIDLYELDRYEEDDYSRAELVRVEEDTSISLSSISLIGEYLVYGHYYSVYDDYLDYSR